MVACFSPLPPILLTHVNLALVRNYWVRVSCGIFILVVFTTDNIYFNFDDGLEASTTKAHHEFTSNISCYPNGTSCVDPTGIIGEWTFVDPRNRSFASPICCGWGDHDFARNEEECGDSWPENMTILRGIPGNIHQRMCCNACTCDKFVDKYEWKSPNLPSKFDAVETCRLLGNQIALFIGDSTMFQTATTLMNSLIPGNCQMQIIFGLSDTLVGKNFGHLNRGAIWMSYVQNVQPDIVFVAVGAHISNVSFTDIVDQVLRDMKELQQKQQNITLAWKTQQPGGCTEDIFLPKHPSMVHYLMDPSVYSYNWDQFYERDLMLIHRLQKVGVPYLDMRMLYSRSDSHIGNGDCIHMCSPGPLDVIGLLFQQFLIDMKNKQN